MRKNRLMIRTIILIIVALAIGFSVYSSLTKEKDGLAIGEEAPNFKLTDLNGNEVELKDYRGKGVFLNFWGTYCEPCKEEMPAMNRQYEKYKKQGVEILAVNVNEADVTVRNFVERYHLNFPVAIDKTSEVMDAYKISPLPTTYLIDKNGIVVGKITSSLNDDLIAQQMEHIKP